MIIDFIDVDSEKWRTYGELSSFPLSAIYRREAKTLRRYEGKLIGAFDHCVVTTEVEAEALRRHERENSISVVSNGVDLEYFKSASSDVSHNRRNIVFTGVMDYFPNVDAVRYFCESIFPRVRDAVPGGRFYIVGRNPTRQVRKLARQSGVVVTGTVPDVRPYFMQAAVGVAPFRLARGVQNKVLEAMAMGLPVVGTSETFKGIMATEADGIRIADDPRSFAKAVIALLKSNPDTRRRLAKQTRSYVERNHRWEDQGEKLDRILLGVIERRRGSASLEIKNSALA
jgi:sugar transferase (PEP-CTERM/EpsH1 system associated)